MKDASEMPESLSQESIINSVKNSEQSKKKKGVVKKVIACAAAFAIVLSGVYIGFNAYSPKIKKIAPKNGEDSAVYTSDYTEIQNFFISLKKNYDYEDLKDKTRIDILSPVYNYGKSTEADMSANGVTAKESSMAGSDSANSSSVTGNANFSQTEIQVEGVDEADIAKTDGRYIYIVDSRNYYCPAVYIVDPSDPGNMSIAAKLDFKATDESYYSVKDMYVSDGRLIVICSESRNDDSVFYNDKYCCFPGSYGNHTAAFVYDISNPAQPVKTAEYSVDGNCLSTRLTDGKLIVVTHYSVPLYNDEEKLKEECIPSYYINGAKTLIPENSIAVIKDNEEDSYSVVALIDLASGKTEAAAVLGGGDEIYCNKTDLYIAKYIWRDFEMNSSYTTIYRFELTSPVSFKSSCTVRGTFLNQFSMDEYGGYFRIATTENQSNTVTVLDKNLDIVGSVGGIAMGEQIYAVRFIGNTAYVVTFRRTDPLFVIDLSDPTSPRIKGELKIPGFSNMLYPFGDGRLIGIGEDGDENGSNGKLKISLFDVSDPQNPKEISKAVMNNYAYTPAAYEHKAFLRMADGNSFVIPISGDYSYAENGGDGYYYNYVRDSFLCSFTVSGDKISEYKKYAAESKDLREIERGLYIGNTLFSVAGNGISAFDINSAELLSSVVFEPTGDEPVVYNDGDVVIY